MRLSPMRWRRTGGSSRPISVVTVILYGVFLYTQTIRHRDYFINEAAGDADGGEQGRASRPEERAQRFGARLIGVFAGEERAAVAAKLQFKAIMH